MIVLHTATEAFLAYIGPGSGLAISVSLLSVVLIVLTVLLGPIAFPLAMLWHVLRRRRVHFRHPVRTVVVLGLDGLDPKLLRHLMDQGKLPHFASLARQGHFSELETVAPPLTPAAWSSFMTGNDPSRHGIYDFITRDPHTYLPKLSSCQVDDPPRVLRIGPLRIPLSSPHVRMLRKGIPFWRILARHGLEVSVLRVPITFPPEPFPGRLLSGMCIPDLLGTQGTYTCFATQAPPDAPLPRSAAACTASPNPPPPPLRGGPKGPVVSSPPPNESSEDRKCVTAYKPRDLSLGPPGVTTPALGWTYLGTQHTPLDFLGSVAHSRIPGPMHPFLPSRQLSIPFAIRRTPHLPQWTLHVGRHRIPLHPDAYTPWIPLTFRAGPIKIRGLVQFYLRCTGDDIQLYMTPIHLDPEHPPMPISHPPLFSNYLAKSIGPFGTLGLIEDTSALNDGALDQQGFLHQAWQAYAERKEMFLRALETRADDLLVCVFDTPDRIQHMFWRQHRDPNPSDVIEQMMIEVDDLLGQTMSRLSPETLLLVISDHGFTHYDRSVNLNAWLHQHGYLHLLPGATPAKDWLEGVDWSRTRAYALGLTGIYINLQGRESSGIVSPGPEYDALVAELKSALEDLRDPANDPGNAPNESSDSRKCSTSSKPRDLSLGPSMSLASASGRTHLGQHAIRRVLITNQHYSGPYRLDGPDLIIGYEAGYRCSWECARGQVTDTLFADNNRPWSGDHCVDPELVPGVLLSNMPFGSSNPRILDIAPTILDVFGIPPETPMQGASLFDAAAATPDSVYSAALPPSPGTPSEGSRTASRRPAGPSRNLPSNAPLNQST